MVHCNNSAIRQRCQHTVRSFGRGNTGAHPCQARGRGWAHPAAPVPGHARGQTLVLVGTGRARQGRPPPPLAQKKRPAHIETAVHGQIGTRDVARLVGTEEGDRVSDFIGLRQGQGKSVDSGLGGGVVGLTELALRSAVRRETHIAGKASITPSLKPSYVNDSALQPSVSLG